MAYRSLWENDAKELKFLILSESRVNWNEDIKWQTEAIIVEISYSNLETVRYSPKSEVSQIIRESWQHCCLPNSFPKFFYVVWKKCLVEIFVWCEVGFFGPLLKISLLKLSSFVNEDIQIMVTLTKWIRHPLHSSFNRGVPWICFAVKMGRNSSNTCILINLLFVWNVRALHQFHKHPPLSQLCFKQAKLW